MQELKQSVRKLLEDNILRFWIEKMTDHEHGGFYGQMTGDGHIIKEAVKGGILNARLLRMKTIRSLRTHIFIS